MYSSGVWNLPYVSEAVLINGDFLNKINIVYEDNFFDAAMSFATNLREDVSRVKSGNLHFKTCSNLFENIFSN